MQGQLSLLNDTVYEYWECKKKAQPDSINTPKCIKVSLSASHVYWYCPTCRSVDSIYKYREGYGRSNELAERCDCCGQRIYFDNAEIEAEPYFQKMVRKRDLVIQKERSGIFNEKKKALNKQLRQGAITQEEYKNLIKVEELRLLGKYAEAEELRKQYAAEKWRKENTPFLV